MKLFEKNELKLLWPFYLDSFLSPMLFFAPAFIIIFFSKLDLSFFQIGLLMSVAPLAALLFEIPTGAIADLYGRKFSVLLGYFLEAISVLMLYFASTYYPILFIMGLWGIAATFSSGSKEAWIVDRVNKNQKLVHGYFNKTQFLDSFALIISGLLGALLVKQFGISIIWIFAFISFLVSITILLFSKEDYVPKEPHIKKAFVQTFKQAKKTIQYGYKHHVLFYYLLATFILMISLSFNTGLTWTPFLKELSAPDYAFGYMWSLIALMTMIAPLISSRLLKRGKERKFIIICFSLFILSTLLIFLPNFWIQALMVMVLMELFIEMRTPASRIYFHRFIPSNMRATMGSIKGMLICLGGVISPPIIGYLIDLIGPRYTIILAAPLTIPALIIYMKIKEKR